MPAIAPTQKTPNRKAVVLPSSPRPRPITRLAAALAAGAFGGLLALGTPAGASGPTATMTPTRGLVDGQRTTIHGSGFPANTNVEVLECSGTLAAPPKDLSSCDGFTADTTGYSDEHGGYLNTPGDKAGGTSGYRIWVLPTSREAGMTIRCGAQDPCVLYVGVNFEDFKEPHTFVSMSFAPGAVSTLPGAPHSGLRATSAHHHSSVAPWAVAVAVMAIAGAAIVALVRRRRADGQPGDPRGRAAATFGEVAGKQP